VEDMRIKDKLNQIRTQADVIITQEQKLLHLLVVSVLGILMGFLSKYTDGTNLGLIGTGIGFWILLTTVIAAWSRSPKVAALNAFIFLGSVLIAYYVYSMLLFGFFPTYYFIAWGTIALFTPIGGYLIWFSRGIGWISALLAAIPISLLLVKGAFFFEALTIPLYSLTIPTGFNLLSAVLLFIILPKKGLQQLRILPLVIILFILIEHFDISRYLPA